MWPAHLMQQGRLLLRIVGDGKWVVWARISTFPQRNSLEDSNRGTGRAIAHLRARPIPKFAFESFQRPGAQALKPFSPTLHSAIDYATVLIFAAAPPSRIFNYRADHIQQGNKKIWMSV
jgi:hypothetical protein